ncbi:MAG: hypothetical protein N3B01_02695 [Verrucomicrobiae bacterium]|nr:hypothetical protein [Verrucomicrobiae bacterium]
MKATLRFPLPAPSAVVDELAVTLNDASVRDRLRVREHALELERPLKAGEEIHYEISFRSRGLSYWYFQVREPREIRDLELVLTLPDIQRKKLNYPEGCMTPTRIADQQKGVVLTYKLDRALSTKGMGVEMPKLKQPGELAGNVLGEIRKGWLLVFAALLLAGTLAGFGYTPLLAVFACAAVALAYGLLGDFTDTPLGFWGAATVVLVPIFALLAIVIYRVSPAFAGRVAALQLLLFGLVYPLAAGLDNERQLLYLNLCGLVLVAAAALQLTTRLRQNR